MDDGSWWVAHSLDTFENGLRAPTMITQQYQDEQTGPTGGFLLWEHVPAGVPKRLVLTNGVHDTNVISQPEELAWLDCWVIKVGHHCGPISDPAKRVQIRFETTGPGNVPSEDTVNPAYVANDFPVPATAWAREYLHGNGAISTAPPQANEAKRTYIATPEGRQGYLSGAGVADALGSTEGPETLVDGLYQYWYGPPTTSKGPDLLTWEMSFARTTAVEGPIPVTLWLSSTSVDTDVFVEVIDEGPHGSYQFLQRGILRASYRAVDPFLPLRISAGREAGHAYWYDHPFTNRQLLNPGQLYQLQLDIPPIGNVFRPGHRLLVELYSPPFVDELNAYSSMQPPALNTVVDSPTHPSTVLLPILPTLPPMSPTAPACGSQVGVRCVKPSPAP